jgi:hypothetical protein
MDDMSDDDTDETPTDESALYDDYVNSVTVSDSQFRDSIGSSSMDDMIEEEEQLGRSIRIKITPIKPSEESSLVFTKYPFMMPLNISNISYIIIRDRNDMDLLYYIS